MLYLKVFFSVRISATYNNVFAKSAPGIVTQAVLLTFGAVISMYLLYRFRVIKVTEQIQIRHFYRNCRNRYFLSAFHGVTHVPCGYRIHS